jgi:hypothetical protein
MTKDYLYQQSLYDAKVGTMTNNIFGMRILSLRIKLKRRHARVIECASSTFALNEYDVFFFKNQ